MTKRFIMGFLLVAIFIVFFEWLFHGIFLQTAYQATSHLWRAPETMSNYLLWMLAGQLLFAFIFCLLFTITRCQTTIKDGATFGLVIGLLMSAVSLAYYAVMPIPISLMAAWVIGGLVETIIAGVLFTLVYSHSNNDTNNE